MRLTVKWISVQACHVLQEVWLGLTEPLWEVQKSNGNFNTATERFLLSRCPTLFFLHLLFHSWLIKAKYYTIQKKFRSYLFLNFRSILQILEKWSALLHFLWYCLITITTTGLLDQKNMFAFHSDSTATSAHNYLHFLCS